jgi:hypothetical protein
MADRVALADGPPRIVVAIVLVVRVIRENEVN